MVILMQRGCSSDFAQHEPYKVKIPWEVHRELKRTERDGIRGLVGELNLKK